VWFQQKDETSPARMEPLGHSASDGRGWWSLRLLRPATGFGLVVLLAALDALPSNR
jgi:hypothetical protein